VKQVRTAIAASDVPAAERALAESEGRHGQTPEWLEAYSWVARGHLAAERNDEAERHALKTYDVATAMLKSRPMDAEPRLPVAYGAAVEVLGQVEARRGARSDAVAFLERERTTHAGTSIEKRIQKNINLLSLEGAQAPEITATEHLGATSPSLETLRGKVVLLFFWAHWCSDCKQMAPVLAGLDAAYRDEGLVILAPTQRYGYVEGGREATPDEETPYIDKVRRQAYPVIADDPVPLDAANHVRYGVSSTPTVVLVDRDGRIRLYHPGQMTREALEPLVQALLASAVPSP
jgi:thiol-disulfide isomerase/thioredoxin